MRMLIFCGTRDAIERFDAVGVSIIAGIYPQELRAKKLSAWRADPNGRLAVDRSMLHGWKAPSDTFVLFDPSWPYGPADPHTIQAVARRITPHMERKSNA